MKLTTKLSALTLALSLTTILVACGGGGGTGTSTAGIGGSGIISTGTITGFGSVIVNGVKFETTNASFNIEGNTGTQEDLAIGMVVEVNGTINPDGITGTARSIVFDDDLQGPVTNYVLSADGLTATFEVLGIPVQIDSQSTYFDPDHGGISITTIQNNDMVELSGFFDATGTLIASRIENKTGVEENVEVKGTVSNWNNVTNTFHFNGMNITVNAANANGRNILQNNLYIEVKGTYNPATRTITARKIESEEMEYLDNESFEIEGLITDYNPPSNFKVNGIPVDAGNNPEMEPPTMQLTNNVHIEVEGYFVNGTLIATELKMRRGEVEIQAPVHSIDNVTNRFTVEFESNQFMTIAVVPETEIEDSDYNYLTFLDHLQPGDFVEVEGYSNNTNNIVFATEIEIADTNEDIEIQGVIEEINLNTIKVLGIEFTMNGSTRFEDDDEISINQSEFTNLVTLGRSVIKMEDQYPYDGIADKIEIESH